MTSQPSPLAETGPAGAVLPDITLVVVASHRVKSLVELCRELLPPLASMGAVELVLVAEPWLQDLAGEVREPLAGAVSVRTLVASHTLGETGLVRMAVPHCRAPRLLIVSGGRRVTSASLPGLVRALDDADLAVARRWPRTDGRINRLQSRLANGLIGHVLGSPLRDIGSGVRAIRRDAMAELPIYGDLFRFLPVLAARDGYRVAEVDCPQHPGERQPRLYRPGIYLRRLLDLLGVYFLSRFTEKPLRFFGLLGGLLSLLGGGVLAVLLVQRFVAGTPMADRPLLLLGVVLLAGGMQAIALGLVGELVVHSSAGRYRRYRTREDPTA